MSLAGTVQAAASRALKAYGAKATLSHSTTGAYDPNTGGASVTTTTVSCSALLNASSTSSLGFKFGQDLVQSGDMMATVSGVIPAPGDVLTVLSGPYAGAYTVIKPAPEFVGSAVVMCACLVRR